MSYTVHENKLPPADQCQAILEVTVVRAKQEHHHIKQLLQHIYSLACTARGEAQIPRLNTILLQLSEEVRQLLDELQSHNRWEKTELFPYASQYLDLEPDLFASFEKEYGLAEKCIRAYLQMSSNVAVPIQHEEAYRMTSFILQAYAVLNNRLVEEEDIMKAATDQSNPYDY